jgi:hypothetical protein
MACVQLVLADDWELRGNGSGNMRLKASFNAEVLHATDVIYRTETLQAFRLGILNAHIGVLPRYRGRSVMEGNRHRAPAPESCHASWVVALLRTG